MLITCSKICIWCFFNSSDLVPFNPSNKECRSTLKAGRPPSVTADTEWAIMEPQCNVEILPRWKYLYIFFLPASRDSFSFLIEEVAWASIALILLIALTWKMVHWIKISSQIIRMPEQSLSVICTKIININDKSCILHHCKNAYKTNKFAN